ncbi:RDD family protein [Nocardia australiensis]|uniref:RDD family protein n=1 Tax=Nocardia australiensis TaxID=2887191 RepID=UPI001D137F99|nr:RDD family protein [Nocardia australiensis]
MDFLSSLGMHQAKFHGDTNDPRYPSPRELRSHVAVLVDMLLHAGVALAVVGRDTGLVWAALLVVVYAAASFIHTTVIQRITHATLGKAVVGLVLIRGSDGDRPSFGRLLEWYFLRVFLTIGGMIFDDEDPWQAEYGRNLVAVRRRDFAALRAHPLPPAAPPNTYHPNSFPPQSYPPNTYRR